MKRDAALWMRTVAEWVPSRVGSAILLGAWLALTLLFTFVGNVVIITAVVAMGQSLATASLLVAVFGVFATPAVSLVVARRVVAGAVVRFESAVRQPAESPDRGRLDPCVTNERGDCRTASCC